MKSLIAGLTLTLFAVSGCSQAYDPIEEFCYGWQSNDYEQSIRRINSALEYMKANSGVSVYGGAAFKYANFVEFYEIIFDENIDFSQRKQAIELITTICDTHKQTKEMNE
jgi:hypothetical protein